MRIESFIVLAFLIFLAFFISKEIIEKPVVAVLDLTQELKGIEAKEIISALNGIYANNTIKALVLNIDSPGGSAADSEAIYISLKKIREKKPVVAFVARATSGAYYVSIAANQIIVAPTSLLGSVGGITRFVKPEKIPEETIITGPLKTMETKRDLEEKLQKAVDLFIETIFLERNPNLSKEELAMAKIYSGLEAINLGLADKIGSLTHAIESAAEFAGLKKYKVINLKLENEI